MAKSKVTIAKEAIEAAESVEELAAAVEGLKPEQKNPLGALIYSRMEEMVGEAIGRG